jgi:hypothetical protein
MCRRPLRFNGRGGRALPENEKADGDEEQEAGNDPGEYDDESYPSNR